MKVLIVDDSVVYRSQIKAALETAPWIDVVGVAANGRIAIDKIRSLRPDLLTLDLEMPEMNGIETLREMKTLGLKTKTIVFSSASVKGAEITLEALNLGALDFIPKPGAAESGVNPQERLKALLLNKIEEFFSVQASAIRPPVVGSRISLSNFHSDAIVIGSSTGGPSALEKIFTELKGPFSIPIFIAQHMPPVFTASLAQRLEKMCGVPAAEGVHGELVKSNRIYIAPGNYHMTLQRKVSGVYIQLNQNEQVNSVRPAVDVLFQSAAEVYRSACLGFVLTGMGRDGLTGAEALRASGNPIVIQNKESCVVFGMPGAVFQAAAYDDIQTLEAITETIRNSVTSAVYQKKGSA